MRCSLYSPHTALHMIVRSKSEVNFFFYTHLIKGKNRREVGQWLCKPSVEGYIFLSDWKNPFSFILATLIALWWVVPQPTLLHRNLWRVGGRGGRRASLLYFISAAQFKVAAAQKHLQALSTKQARKGYFPSKFLQGKQCLLFEEWLRI